MLRDRPVRASTSGSRRKRSCLLVSCSITVVIVLTFSKWWILGSPGPWVLSYSDMNARCRSTVAIVGERCRPHGTQDAGGKRGFANGGWRHLHVWGNSGSISEGCQPLCPMSWSRLIDTAVPRHIPDKNHTATSTPAIFPRPAWNINAINTNSVVYCSFNSQYVFLFIRPLNKKE